MPHMSREKLERGSRACRSGAGSPFSPHHGPSATASKPRPLMRVPLLRRTANAVKLARTWRQLPGPLALPAVFRIVRAVRPYTMVPFPGLVFTIQRAAETALAGRGGAIVECGVWKGGASFAMALAQRAAAGRIPCPVHMLDSFEGLPPATERDGASALAWQSGQDPAQPDAFLRTPEEAVRAAARRLGLSAREVEIHRGWFSDTAEPLARRLAREGGVALLRLDGDWYDSTLQCLEAFGPALQEGAVIIVDDYFVWDGCARAVHDWLSRHDLPWRVRSILREGGAWLRAETPPPRADALPT